MIEVTAGGVDVSQLFCLTAGVQLRHLGFSFGVSVLRRHGQQFGSGAVGSANAVVVGIEKP